ncbi:hypothetical protein L208DRAFT_1332096 [Tricholoma matsutake]|nr:hypothetical protein L208DRAFT_1332096 [Tricholoma matsutake 945]
MLSLGKIQQFVLLAAKLKDDILLAQPTSVLVFDPPMILPPTVTTFLQNSCKISEPCVEACWEVLKSTIWHDGKNLEDSIIADFAAHDSKTLYPPQHNCTNASCSCSRTGKLLKKQEQQQGVLYTLDKGALPVQSIHLYCNECNTNYHHNFQFHGGIHTYYDGIPDIIQGGEHQFAEKQLIQLWITLMLVSWTLATNCACIYNHALSDTAPTGDWAFGFMVTTKQVWDGFVLLALLEDCQGQSKLLEVPHTGAQKDHLMAALCSHNLYI